MLGFFDSGLGGLTVLREVRRMLPELDLMYLADQAHVPYGDRTPENLQELFASNMRFLNDAGVSAVIMACNTTCAIGNTYGWPSSAAPIIDLIESAVIAVRASGAQRVAILATAATVRSGAYSAVIARTAPDIEVIEVAAPALVPLVEAGELEGDAPRTAVAAACAAFRGDVDAVVYACSHYPLLDKHFAAVLGRGVLRLDPATAQAARAAALAREAAWRGGGAVQYFTTGDVDAFAAAATDIVGAIPGATFASFALT